jgi:hypothetical protein
MPNEQISDLFRGGFGPFFGDVQQRRSRTERPKQSPILFRAFIRFSYRMEPVSFPRFSCWSVVGWSEQRAHGALHAHKLEQGLG